MGEVQAWSCSTESVGDRDVQFAKEAGAILRDLPASFVPEPRYALHM